MAGELPLQEAVQRLCRERGIPVEAGMAAFAELLKLLHEAQVKAGLARASALTQVYWALGGEAAYHLGGLLHHLDSDTASEELRRLDSGLARFATTVDRWEMELQQELEDRG